MFVDLLSFYTPSKRFSAFWLILRLYGKVQQVVFVTGALCDCCLLSE